jgi:N-acetylglucosamine-6-phosphate deacetylase
MGKMVALKAKRMVTPNAVVRDGIVVIEDGRIAAVGTQATVPVPEGAEVVDYGDGILAPGLLDIHCHGTVEGGAGVSPEKALYMANLILRGGTTSVLPTVNTVEATANVAAARRIQKEKGYEGADMVGLNLEGPFVEPKKVPGVNTGDDNKPLPDLALLQRILDAGEGGIRIMGVGILLPDVEKVVKKLREEGIVVSITHTKASAQQFSEAVQMGFNHGTHLYNVMTGLHHRRPGVVGGLLTHDGVTTEIICDSLHVHPWAIDIAIRCKGPDKLAIITDLGLAGAKDGIYHSGFGNGIPVEVKDGIARVLGSNENQDNTMAGSTMLQNVGVRTVTRLGYPLHVAFRMASLTPASIIGVDRYKGSLEITKDADIIVVDDDINVRAAYVKGKLLYEA